MAQRKLEKNPQRYIKIPMGWEVSAAPDDKQAVPPYMISDGISFGQKPTATKLLDDTGALVVELGDEYLVSKRINLDLRDSNETNPHFSYKIRGEVRLPLIDDMGKTIGTKTTPIGKTIPIIRVDIDTLIKKVEEESIPLAKAGVADVVFISEDANKLLGQINFTLSPSAVREMDEYRLYDLNLNDDIYGIEAPSIEGLDENQKIDETKLSKNLEEIDKRLQALNKDFNMIKEVYFNGKAPSGMIKDKSTGTVVDGVTTTTDMQSDPNASKSNDTNPQRIIDESKIVTPPAKSKGGLFGMLGKNRDAINSTTTAVTGLTSRLKALEK
jgi:hypothetical protein